MIPTLIWFVLILFLAILSILAIKFLTLRILLALILLLPVMLSAAYFALRQSPVDKSNSTEFFDTLRVISNRGIYSGNTLANTIQAFKQAKSAGADTIEMDIRMTKDGMLIVYEDPIATDPNNVTYEVSETHWTQLNKLKIIGRNNVPILTFDEALDWCEKNNMKMLWNIPQWNSDMFTYLQHKLLQDLLYTKVALTSDSAMTALNARLSDSDLLIGLTWSSTHNSFKNGEPVGTPANQWLFTMMDSILYWGVRSLLIPEFVGVDIMIIDVNDADNSIIKDFTNSSMLTIVKNVTTPVQYEYFGVEIGLPIMSPVISTVYRNNGGNPNNNNNNNNKG